MSSLKNICLSVAVVHKSDKSLFFNATNMHIVCGVSAREAIRKPSRKSRVPNSKQFPKGAPSKELFLPQPSKG
jgi:hypothetical protein